MVKKLKFGRPEKWTNHKRVKFNKLQRRYIFKRDNYICQNPKCGKDLSRLPKERVLDHKVPLSQLGSNQYYNIQLLCKSCDVKKGAKILPSVIQERIDFLKSKYVNLK